MKAKEFFINAAKGAAIGVAMIIPGVSGGTLAVLMGVYDKIIDSFGGITKHFKASFFFLLPILLGAVLAFAAMYFPLKYALEYAPFPTVTLFAGLMLGSIPDLVITAKGNGFKKSVDIISIIIPLAVVVGICFIPHLGDVNLTSGMKFPNYLLLFVMGLLASCALVVPGISGSMLMLIFGYYQPLLNTISALKSDFGHALLVLAVFAVGVVVGFFTIAKLMQFFLKKFRRVTFWAIVGFVIGSVPAVIITFFYQFGVSYLDTLQICLGVLFFLIGTAASFLLALYAKKCAKRKIAEPTETADQTESTEPTEPTENLERDDRTRNN